MSHLFYFFVVLTSVLAATTTNADRPLLDVDGDEINVGGSYYITAVPNGRHHNVGGGLSLASHGSDQCPLDVVQAPSINDVGVPIQFSNWRSDPFGHSFVPEGKDLNIEMMSADGTLTCGGSNYWRVDYNSWRVVAGPKPERYEEDGFFQIQKSDYHHYKFSYCQGFFDGIRKLSWPSFGCTDVGIHQDRYGVRRLALNNGDFSVMFKKANETEALSRPMPM